MVANQRDLVRVAEDLDLSPEELRRQVGGASLCGSEALRQRLASLLDIPVADEEPPVDSHPDDARLAGALIRRLGDSATATIIASWMGWTLPRTTAALAELDLRLVPCGLRLHADGHGQLRIRERARLRRRPESLPSQLLARLDQPASRHALAHFVRGDRCPDGDDQCLIDLGVVVDPWSRDPRPHPAVAAAFAGAVTSHTQHPRRAALIVIDPHRPGHPASGSVSTRRRQRQRPRTRRG
jgi:hypothetical protein